MRRGQHSRRRRMDGHRVPKAVSLIEATVIVPQSKRKFQALLLHLLITVAIAGEEGQNETVSATRT
jgi:hypothetical protein